MTSSGPVLVRPYTLTTAPSQPQSTPATLSPPPPLPAISSYAFASILRAAESPELQTALDGIAEICARTRMSLADEYAAHLPPLGEITTANAAGAGGVRVRPGMGGRALTAVPEGGSSSSEGSRRMGKGKGKAVRTRTRIFGFRKAESEMVSGQRKVRIGSMGRVVSVGSTTALATDLSWRDPSDGGLGIAFHELPIMPQRVPSEAALSLQRLLGLAAQSQPQPE
ncbi:hypothetical protein BAUCODRAFT_222100 [Baudoinia panamericana UAMH 10762]|uniref:Uncharacterized protein n=1 Tax=Baudoinia panamericana (strain UAMH 10762) TaxID=717646 RepID=M2MCA5_BAUPA|nr:uncharacterized protein BAUCODRAFT_222100 [Baudoinia panamericana UAMH 10762]EMC94146.1 hypothetical protein BAUCODRAFT_222100 [Baudoinia panamericana UAMH 10762]